MLSIDKDGTLIILIRDESVPKDISFKQAGELL